MADSVTFTMDAAGVIEAISRLGDAARPYVNEAAHVTARAVVREAKARLARSLGPNATGKTEAGITDRPASDGNGFIVIAERDPLPSLPFWIERGTKRGQPHSHTSPARPFFYASVLLEEGAHERRVAEALQQAIDAQGLGV